MKLGKAFSDSISTSGRHDDEHRHIKSESHTWWLGAGRILIITVLLFVSMFVLIIRLFDLTVVHGHQYRTLADGNRTKELIRHAPRGIFLDRTGKPLTVNLKQFRLLKPCDANVMPTEEGACVSYLRESEGERMAAGGLSPGTFLEVDYERTYPFGPSTAHVLGYIGEISEQELHDEYYQLRKYQPGDRIGRMGAEAIWEEKVRGRDGKELVEVDATGRITRVLGRDEEVAGESITLAIDGELSRAVSRAFPKDLQGAVVVSKPQTGEILALYSSPSFDPGVFVRGMQESEYRDFIKDPTLPLLNRAISGVYPPGSTFKLVTALAGLEEGIITKDTVIVDTGVITTGAFSFSNWYYTQYGKTEGPLSIVRALARSNDIYFYTVGERIGIERIATWGRAFGIGSLTGIELGGEASGLMPDGAWKEKHFVSPEDLVARNNLWYDGDTYHVAIGQGYLLTTPLQVNVWTNVVANHGVICRPTIQKVDGTLHKAICKDLSIKKESTSPVTSGMVQACIAGGTGWPFFEFGVGENDAKKRIPVACKTGTAEIGDPHGKTHAWFTVFAPIPEVYSEHIDPSSYGEVLYGEPEISVTVLLEKGGEGSTDAAPIAKDILSEWFGR